MEAATAPAGMSARRSINSTYSLSLVVLLLSTVRGRRRGTVGDERVLQVLFLGVLHFLPSIPPTHTLARGPQASPSPTLDGVLPVPGMYNTVWNKSVDELS